MVWCIFVLFVISQLNCRNLLNAFTFGIIFCCMWLAGSIALGQYMFPFSLQLPNDLPGKGSQSCIH